MPENSHSLMYKHKLVIPHLRLNHFQNPVNNNIKMKKQIHLLKNKELRNNKLCANQIVKKKWKGI